LIRDDASILGWKGHVLLRRDERREQESRQQCLEDEHPGIVQPEKKEEPTLS
jgi:hypothetical protein